MLAFDWEKIVNWKLLHGSHEFPGPDGGTCINEAAIIAAGFAYRKVAGLEDLPACFSPVIGCALIYMNDSWRDEDRQTLMPFVTKLAGSRRTNEVENARLSRLVELVVSEQHVARRLAKSTVGLFTNPETGKTVAMVDNDKRVFYEMAAVQDVGFLGTAAAHTIEAAFGKVLFDPSKIRRVLSNVAPYATTAMIECILQIGAVEVANSPVSFRRLLAPLDVRSWKVSPPEVIPQSEPLTEVVAAERLLRAKRGVLVEA